MSIENLLNKIIVNYKKKNLSLKITPAWTLQEASCSHGKIDNVESPPVYSQHFQHLNSKVQQSDSFTPIAMREEHYVSDVNMIEWRSYERKDISIPIDFTSLDRLYKEMTKDISAGGLFIETQKYNKLTKNQKVLMVFTIGEGKKTFKLTGKVIRVDSKGIAVQFHNISPFDCAAIEESLSNRNQ
jgi:Tfp pilus assembly protein PilZ